MCWLVLFVVCCVFCAVEQVTFELLYQQYLLCRKLDIKSAKMADLCALLDKSVHHNILNIKRMPKLSSFIDFRKFLTFGMAWCEPLKECATKELLNN